jgi:hypothetical protein
MSSFYKYLSEQFEMVLSLEEFCDVACASWLVEFSENVKALDITWCTGDLCDVQAHSAVGPVWLQGQVVDVHPGGAVQVRILRRSMQTCKSNWIHPMHLMPRGAKCGNLKMNNLWTPTNEIEWAVHPPLP